MRKDKVLWTMVLVGSIILLIVYSLWGATLLRNTNYGLYGQKNYDRGMMGRWFNNNDSQLNSGEKLSVDDIGDIVTDYVKGYDTNLEISDIFVYKDTDYYVSVEEKETGRGAMELLVNPYTGRVYPEYGPSMMWNEKYGMRDGYGMHDGYGMMNNDRWNMMGGTDQHGNYSNGDNRTSSKSISRDQAIAIADQYVKDNSQREVSVNGEGHEFYGYYTFHISKDKNTVGMISVNYYTGDVWYHDWHGELEQVISAHKE